MESRGIGWGGCAATPVIGTELAGVRLVVTRPALVTGPLCVVSAPEDIALNGKNKSNFVIFYCLSSFLIMRSSVFTHIHVCQTGSITRRQSAGFFRLTCLTKWRYMRSIESRYRVYNSVRLGKTRYISVARLFPSEHLRQSASLFTCRATGDPKNFLLPVS